MFGATDVDPLIPVDPGNCFDGKYAVAVGAIAKDLVGQKQRVEIS